MRVLIGHPDAARRAEIRAALDALPRTRVIEAVSDLTDTYTIAEHKVPNAVVVATSLARAPEFEVLCALFRALSIQCVLIAQTRPISAGETALAGRLGLAIATPEDLSARLGAPVADDNAGRTEPSVAKAEPKGFDDGFILLGASTGGVDALIRVLSVFPANCPPTLIVQHTGAQFTEGLAKLIDGHVAPAVELAQGGMKLAKGRIRIAPGGTHHLIMARAAGVCSLVADPPCHGHRPSVDRLFRSAVPAAPRAAAALLTGMGRDGAEGLLALRQAGARTFAQDEARSVVYGMPRVAFEIGAVERQLPLEAIGPALLEARQRRMA